MTNDIYIRHIYGTAPLESLKTMIWAIAGYFLTYKFYLKKRLLGNVLQELTKHLSDKQQSNWLCAIFIYVV